MNAPSREPRDEGTVLILALVLVIIGSLIVLPLMSYASAVLKANKLVETKNTRVEATEGGIRVAMYDPTKLYTACLGGPTIVKTLATPPAAPGVPSMQTTCTQVDTSSTNKPGEQRFALTTTQVGSELVIPPSDPDDVMRPELNGTISSVWCTSKLASSPVPCGKPYPNNGNAVTTTWQNDVDTASTTGKVFLPFIPPPDSDTQPASGFVMPAWADACRVFFPGTYNDDVVLDTNTPVYFVSGIYYFKKSLRITGSAGAGTNVVVGTGPVPGCVDSDSTAALSAIDAATGLYPNRKQIDGASGVGGTFVFGAEGRLVVDTASAGDISFVMNRRLQAASKPEAVMNDVSIVTVNGVTTGAATAALDLPAQLNVPPSRVLSSTPANEEPAGHGYTSSTLVSPLAPAVSCASPAAFTTACPVVDVNLSTAASVTVHIPGYVAVPQGSLAVTTAGGAEANKDISFGGGVLAAQVAVGPSFPGELQIGVVETIVQRKFKVVTRTTQGQPVVTATAIVQVNETGGYAINSYTVETGS
jgi:hypothetical protein